MNMKTFLMSAAAAALTAGTASADLFVEYDRTTGYDGFQTGFNDTGYYDAWDRNDDDRIAENEFATGVYADWDTNNDMEITEDEYEVGAERWYGSDYDTSFGTWDLDRSETIDRNEFSQNWDSEYYAGWDTNEDTYLDRNEYSTGVYNTADLNNDTVIQIEEEGWFEGWFDGDDVEAEIEQVGDVM